LEKDIIFSSGADVIYLTSCVLNGRIPTKENIDRMELEAVYKQASRHSMQAITYSALSSYISAYGRDSLNISRELFEKWGYERASSIKRAVGFDIEREKIIKFFEQNGIWYMPLKGIIFQNYYPGLGTRQMCDNDIMFDPSARQALREYMEALGYSVHLFGSPYPDTYKKDRYCFEMHHALYTDTKTDEIFSEYYRDVTSRLIKDEGSAFGYHFSDEDFYIYCMTHSYKHFCAGGNGIRALSDVYAFLKNVGDKLDEGYIENELRQLGILEYDRMTRRLSSILFDPDCVHLNGREGLGAEDLELIGYFIDSGTYGTETASTVNRLKEISKDEHIGFLDKLRYCFKRIFPGMDYYKLNHPVAYKYKIPIVGIWFMRIFKLIFKKPKKLIRELKLLIKTK